VLSRRDPTEAPITDRREKELADLGFIPLVHCKGTDYAAFFSVQSGQKAKVYDSEAANANARLSTQLPYILAVSRFAHYLKAMMRDKVGSFMSRSDAEVLAVGGALFDGLYEYRRRALLLGREPS